MKTKILIPIICVCSLFGIQAQEWGYVNTLTDEWLRKIWTQGLDTVYIVGENGLIARSTDQGETWDKQYPTQAALNDIIFIDHYTGFVVGKQGAILKTTDAGETWESITLDVSSHINAIAATGLNNIWAVGDNSLILHSTDTGETWEQVNILLENNIQLLDIAFRENLGYFTGDYFTVYKTEDFGVVWNKQTVPEILGPYFSTNAHSINIMENKIYLMLGDYLYSTEDQINWMSVYDDANIPGVDPFFLNDNVGYISVADGATCCGGVLVISKTVNGGKDWGLIEERVVSCCLGFDVYPSKIRMVNDTLGYAIFTQLLLKIPALKNPVGVEKIKNNVKFVTVQITGERLVLQSESNPIQSVEIFDTLGKKLIYKKWQNPVQETNININILPKSIYLIKTTHEDSTISIEKISIR